MSVVRALDDPDDAVFSNHRNHGHYLTYSGDALGLVAEIMGRKDGVCGGYGGSQHIAFRNFHSNGVQAGMTAIATGVALDLKRRSSRAVVAVMIGDGTLGEGLLYESLNLASIWWTRVLFVVENNGIAQTTDTKDTGRLFEGRGKGLACAHGTSTIRSPALTSVADVVAQIRNEGWHMLVVNTRRLGPP
jgi:2-oxoisovalerate dehydrogenase E1 component